jgi:hypothetical protein
MESDFSESSYLLVAAKVGLVGLIPLLFAMVMLFLDCYRSTHLYRQTGKTSLALRLPLALFALTAVGGLAEAYLLSTFHLLVLALVLSAQMGASAEPAMLGGYSSLPESQTDLYEFDPQVAYPIHRSNNVST